MFLMLLKIIVSVVVVLSLSYVAETVSSKWAGIISGLPTGSAIILYFYAIENGLAFASESALYNMIGLVAMQSFIFGYYVSNRIVENPSVLVSTVSGFLFYLLAASAVSSVNVTPGLALIVSSVSFVIFVFLFKEIKPSNNKKPISLTVRKVFIRSFVSGAIIVSITAIAFIVGSKWSGIFSAFPTTLYPLIVILHLDYGKEAVDSVIKYVPQGLGGLLVYSFVIHVSYRSTDVNLGVFYAFMSTASYLLVLSFVKRVLKDEVVRPD